MFIKYSTVAALLFTSACTAHIDQQSVKASINIPEAARVDQISIAYNNQVPKIYLTVEPIKVRMITNESEVEVTGAFDRNRTTKNTKNSDSKSRKDSLIDDHYSSGKKSEKKSSPPIISSEGTQYQKVSDQSGPPDGSQTDSARHAHNATLNKTNNAQSNHFNEKVNGTSIVNIHVKQYQEYFLSRQRQITNQLNSALAGVKNFKLLDYEINKKNNFNYPKGDQADLGVYIVRATITECNDQVKYEKNKSTIPTIYTKKNLEIVKMIGLDVQIVDPKTGEIVQALPVQGSYTYKDSSIDGGLIFDFSTSREVVQSSIDQALRVALNDAAFKIFNGFQSQ